MRTVGARRCSVHDVLALNTPEGVVPRVLCPESLGLCVIREDAAPIGGGEVERGIRGFIVGNHVTNASTIVDLFWFFGRDLWVENVYGQGSQRDDAEHHDDDFGGAHALVNVHDFFFRCWVNIDSLDLPLNVGHLRSSLRHLLRRQELLGHGHVLLFHPREPGAFCGHLHESLHERARVWGRPKLTTFVH